jgi:nitrile hydratase subunit beta
MQRTFFEPKASENDVVLYTNEEPIFTPGDPIRVLSRMPVGHYRVPHYLRGKRGVVQTVISPIALDNEEEGFGRNAGDRGRYYRISVQMKELWADYQGNARDTLNIEVYQSWLEKLPTGEG